MKSLKIVAAVALTISLSACTCRERYDRFLGRVESNLRDDVLPKYRAGLVAQGRPEAFVENDVALLEDTILMIERVRGGADPEEFTGE